jgi:hypothetical protein
MFNNTKEIEMRGKKTKDEQDERTKTFDTALDIMSYVCNEGLCPGESFIINQAAANYMILRKKDGDIRVVVERCVSDVLVQSLVGTLDAANHKKQAGGRELSVPISMAAYMSSVTRNNNANVFMTADWLHRIAFEKDPTRRLMGLKSFVRERGNDFIHVRDKRNIIQGYDVIIDKKTGYDSPEGNRSLTMDVISNNINNDIRTSIIITNDEVTDDDIHRSDSIMRRIPSIMGRGSMTIIADNRDFGAMLCNISDHTMGSGLIAYIGAKPRSLSNPMIVQMISEDQYQPYKIDNAISMHCLGIIIDDVTSGEVCRHAIIAALSGLDVYLLMRGRDADDVQAKFEALVYNHAYIEAFESQKKRKSFVYSSIMVQ